MSKYVPDDKKRQTTAFTFAPATIKELRAAAEAADVPASRFAEKAILAFIAAQRLTGQAGR